VNSFSSPDKNRFPAEHSRYRRAHNNPVVVCPVRCAAAQTAAVDRQPVRIFVDRAAEIPQQRRNRRETVAFLDAQPPGIVNLCIALRERGCDSQDRYEVGNRAGVDADAVQRRMRTTGYVRVTAYLRAELPD